MRLFATLLLLTGCYEAGVERPHNPTNEAQHHYQRAGQAVKAGQLNTAIHHADLAAAADPEFDAAALLQASLLGRAGRFEDGLEVCRNLLRRSPDLVEAHLLEGILWDQSGDREHADQSYDEALRRYDTRMQSDDLGSGERLRYALATYLRHGELEGVRAVNDVLEAFPEHPKALYLKACIKNKDRGFLLRWFSQRNGTPAAGEARKPNAGAELPAGAPEGAPIAEKE